MPKDTPDIIFVQYTANESVRLEYITSTSPNCKPIGKVIIGRSKLHSVSDAIYLWLLLDEWLSFRPLLFMYTLLA